MRIDQLILTAFGKFSGATFDLAPGLNLIYGDNEAGKTTIQKFILGMLYGFKKRALRRDYTEDLERLRPWTGEEYRGALVYTVDRLGRSFRVERRFDPRREEVRVYDGVTGADMTGRFPTDRRKELLFAEEHLTIPEEVFRSTAWVGQMEVGKLEMGRELVNRVANMQESGREDISVRTALRILEDRMREIGTDRAPTRPYARLGRLIEEKRQELERAIRIREQSMAWEAQLTEVRAVVAELDLEVAELYRRLDWADLHEARVRLERVRAGSGGARLARERASAFRGYAEFPTHLRERIQGVRAGAAEARAQVEHHRTRLAELQERRLELGRLLERQEAMGRLGPEAAALMPTAGQTPRFDTDQVASLREEAARLGELIARIDETLEPLRPVAASGEQVLSRIDGLEREIASLRLRLDGQPTDRLRIQVGLLETRLRRQSGWWWLALALLFGGLAGAMTLGLWDLIPGLAWLEDDPGFALWGLPGPAVWPVLIGAAALGLLGAVLFARARRLAGRTVHRLAEAQSELDEALGAVSEVHERLMSVERERERALSTMGVASTAEVRNRVVRYEQLSARRDGQQLRLDTVNAEIGRIMGDTAYRRQELDRLIAEAMGMDLEELQGQPDPAASFREARARYQNLRGEADAVERELTEYARREREAAAEAERLDGDLLALLNGAGVESVGDFAEGCARREEYERALAEAEALTLALTSLRGGETETDLTGRVEELQSVVEGEEPAGLESSARLQSEARRLEARRAELQARASDLAARVETALRDLPETADLQQEMEALQEERHGYGEELAALELAHEVITEVSGEIHREFAPKLNQAMGRTVAALTGGKYRNVRIDEEMAIRVIADEERMVDLLSLSGGTVDQFYFGLRVALLDMLTDQQERIPLMLDDPFVQYDRERHAAAMDYLAQLSRERQIILMTCHQREVLHAQRSGAPVQIIDISRETDG